MRANAEKAGKLLHFALWERRCRTLSDNLIEAERIPCALGKPRSAGAWRLIVTA
jgi:hypothetical protein